MLNFSFDSTQTLFIAVILLVLGGKILKKVSVFRKWCLPSAVVGGLLFAIIALILKQTGTLEFKFDTSLQQFFMNLFFTASGLGASLSLLKNGGKKIVIFLVLAAVLAFLQNVLAVGLAGALNVKPMIALMTGSIPMTGGHGNAASFAPIAEGWGYTGALSVAVAAATFGLVSGSILGGPVANQLINKYDLFNKELAKNKSVEELAVAEDIKSKTHVFSAKAITFAFNSIFIGLGIGSVLFVVFKAILPNVTLPIHVMGMMGGVIVRLFLDKKKISVPEEEIDALGNVCLGVFVSMAVFTMKLWELAELALPLIILLFAQVVLMYIFARYITFNLMGKDYDAAMMSAGHIGFGLGAVPVSMANMNAVSEKYIYSKVAFFIVPLIGGLFSNFTNAAIITFFMNLVR
ncbi:MAG: sodium/glutamate symporter [Bacillota bacterium]|jgi:ESS family glutamate:Na+ symporter|nr:sodium/glutamate symporter [Bacillota bacterium]